MGAGRLHNFNEMRPNEKYWFPAKRYGWGWGLPVCRQGWVVMGVWFALLMAGALSLGGHMVIFAFYLLLLGIALTIVCFIKGEKPRWRWGKD